VSLSLVGRDRFLLGRSEEADCVISGSEASREHAELRRDGPLWTIHDLGSRNGIFVNGERVERAPIGPGTVLRLGEAVGLVLRQSQGRTEAPSLREVTKGFFAGVALQRTLDGAERPARSELPIIIEGETGAGKERLARWIHAISGRSGRFVPINCAALPEALAEAQLFGYRKGAFTDAKTSSPGYLREADQGTLLLDEILDLPLALQPKLLRALEEGEVAPLGEATPVKVSVRVIAATQASLHDAVAARAFRGDLLARLEGFVVRLSPLRERIEDVPTLFRRFVFERSGGRPPAMAPRLIESLCMYDWPFNVRELERLAHRLVVVHGHEPALLRSHLPSHMTAPRARSPLEPELSSVGDEYSRFIAALKAHGGVVARAAAAAGLNRTRAYRLMAEHDLDPSSLRDRAREDA
jgi:DNA-binding NtrC family response regulator